MSLAWLPNAITIVRILLVVPTAWLVWKGEFVAAMVLMAIAGASDALDGFLARQFGWASRFGAAADPVADKLLVGVLFVVLTIKGHVPLWVAAIVLIRDGVIFLGALAYRILFRSIELAPTLISKANTAMQIVTVLLLLIALCRFGLLSDTAERIIDPYGFYLLAVLGVTSGVDYVMTWSIRAWREAGRA